MITPLHRWIAQKIGCSESNFTRSALDKWKLERLRQVIVYARSHSRYYQSRLGSLPGLAAIEEFARYPFTTQDEIQNDPGEFVCVPQEEIHRIVTLPTSGTTGVSKRIYFSSLDQELTIDFFEVGMSTLAKADDRVLILLPGERPGSVGDLLAHALERLGCIPFKYGPLDDEIQVLETIQKNGINVIVGSPQHLFRLACIDEVKRIISTTAIRAVLSSTDVLPASVIDRLQKVWKCEVFDHYGMTETGLGAGVECDVHSGYHMREADLFYEIIDPVTVTPLPEGELGEIVVTTLTRQAMPLIRYRTGDLSRILPEKCPCGSFIQRLAPVKARISTGKTLATGKLYPAMLDEVLLRIDGICDFTTSINGTITGQDLQIKVLVHDIDLDELIPQIHSSLASIPEIADAIRRQVLQISVSALDKPQSTEKPIMIKRKILEMRS